MADVAGHIDSVQHEVGHGQHVRQWLFLHAVDGVLQRGAIRRCFDLSFEVINGAGEKSTGAAGWVKHALTQLRVESVHHELSDCARRVVLASVTG